MNIKEKLYAINDQLAEAGILFTVVVAPNKESIYPGHLPDHVQKIGDFCRWVQVVALFDHCKTKILDLRSTMVSAKQEAQVYHKTDTHWNDVGALYASQYIMGELKVEIPDIQVHTFEEYELTSDDFNGDLARFLPVVDTFVEQGLFLGPRFDRKYQYLTTGRDDIKITEIEDSDLPSAVIFRDSFMNALRPFLSDYFSRAVYKSSFTIDLDLIEEEAPDVVIY
jgi:hypothetical protein